MVEIDTTQIEEALDHVLHGHSFSSSRQCQALLRYIVTHTLRDEGNMLRERVIGAEVFGRAPDYDTGNDPVVRSRAAEVRKRLAQHYMHEGQSRSGVRIDVPSGSYRATFDVREPATASRELPALAREFTSAVWEPVPPLDAEMHVETSAAAPPVQPMLPVLPAKQQTRYWTAWRAGSALLGAFALLSLLLIGLSHGRSKGPFERFWKPFASSKRPILYFGGSYTYRLSSQFLDDYRSGHHPQSDGTEVIHEIQNGTMLNERSLIPSNPMIGFGDVGAVARIGSTLTSFGNRYDLRYGSNLTITDLESSPTVLIGGFSNMWTLQLTHDFRYSLDQGGIVDRQQGSKLIWTQSSSADGLRNEDYVVVSRIPNSALGSCTLFIAGINTYSNQAAADFVSDPEKVRAAAQSLPRDWDVKNLQIVLHTTVINQVPIAANVVAVYSW